MQANWVINETSGIKFHQFMDLDATSINSQDLNEIKQSLYENGIVVLKHQSFDQDSFLKFGKQWGTIQKFNLKDYGSKEHPEILFINNNGSGEIKGTRRIGTMWHSDSSYRPDPLPLTFLYALEVPQSGGDTLFINMQSIYNSLGASIVTNLETMYGVHEASYAYRVTENDVDYSINDILSRLRENFPAVKHPAIITHPVTKVKSVYLSHGYTTNLIKDNNEYRELLAEVKEYITKEEHIYSYHWQPQDLVIWDNRSVIHSATDLPITANRKMMRIGIEDMSMY